MKLDGGDRVAAEAFKKPEYIVEAGLISDVDQVLDRRRVTGSEQDNIRSAVNMRMLRCGQEMLRSSGGSRGLCGRTREVRLKCRVGRP